MLELETEYQVRGSHKQTGCCLASVHRRILLRLSHKDTAKGRKYPYGIRVGVNNSSDLISNFRVFNSFGLCPTLSISRPTYPGRMAANSPEIVGSLPGSPSLRTEEESRSSPSSEFPRHSQSRSTGGQRDRETRETRVSTLRPQGGGDCRAQGRSDRRSRRSLCWSNWRGGHRSLPALGGTHRTCRHHLASLSDCIYWMSYQV